MPDWKVGDYCWNGLAHRPRTVYRILELRPSQHCSSGTIANVMTAFDPTGKPSSRRTRRVDLAWLYPIDLTTYREDIITLQAMLDILQAKEDDK